MCGIVGAVRFDGAGVSRARIESMANAIHHRGPDDNGFWIDGSIGFGHRRLSIIDVGGSHQPMHSVDGRWTIVFNGEILNYQELRKALDYPFRTAGDTETILAGLVTHGIRYVDQLVGQFAFAAFDRDTGIVHLVRDRLGILPLYFRRSGDTLLIGSEIKAILAGMDEAPSVDRESLGAYLYGRSVPAPFTLFDGIRKLEAAHRAEVRPDGSITEQLYWAPPEQDAELWTPSAAVDAVDQMVTEAVRSALVADVPVGAYLSGGVDSSLIVAKAAALHGGGRLKTFSAGFGDPRNDELPFARQVSEHVGTDHHEVQVDARDFESLWPTLTWHRDAPMSEPADFAVYRLAQAAREHVTVVLSGEGGDELFAGYPKYRAARAMAAASVLPGDFRRIVGEGIDRHLPARLARARIGLRVWATPERDEQFRTWFAPFSARERAQLLSGVSSRPTSLAVAGRGVDPVRAMLLADLRNWLPDNLLERGDRMSMAASLELRPPLLDHRLVDLAFRLPSSVKLRSGQTKWVLKEVARRYLPASIVDRRKVGFRVPLDTWFRSSLRDSVRERLTGTGSFVAETFDRATIRDLLDRHDSGTFNEESRIWTLMSLEVWHETFFGPAKHQSS
ncbi:asparagine synthase (glutamine-hydrolyzing) [Salinibacterium sp. PAMC 21357]|uniref:asparagine synthase (glutamine-hydrolyzing) n=1 Tax=Salinibacterium sp. PAMC 21357 TaxID=1112215 RepID=UPI00028918AB|nr:asparagine synthase (glutamine-hydrolyzing) [Salinibacterium sp. PAMC 21357]